MIFNIFSLGYTITEEVILVNYPYTEVGERILKLRKQQGLTREKLAESADISVQFLADIEKGRKNMTVTTLRKLARALMTTTDHIVNGIDPELAETDNELITLCEALPPQKRRQAAKLLRVFLEAINANE